MSLFIGLKLILQYNIGMKRLFIGVLTSIIMLISCGKPIKEHWVHYETNNSEYPIATYFYGIPNSFLIHFENDSNQYRLVVVDKLNNKSYYFVSQTPIKIVNTNIKIEDEW